LRTVYSRLLTFFVGIPAVVCVVLFLPFQHHLALNILIIILSIMGSVETANLLKKKGLASDALLSVACGSLFPIAAYLQISGFVAPTIIYLLLPFVLWIILFTQLFSQDEKKVENALMRTSADILIAVYPGALAGFLVRITSLERPELAFLIFIVAVFANDSSAYVFGMLFGKGNRGIFPVSPQKSIVGLTAGLLFSLGSTLIFYRFFPEFFGNQLYLAFIVGFGVGIATISGDLAESAFKRSAGVKDSGKVIPGRGGILDSVDSVIFSAPVFYLLIHYFS
jgi:phosphatidate cytidylyltransferase